MVYSFCIGLLMPMCLLGGGGNGPPVPTPMHLQSARKKYMHNHTASRFGSLISRLSGVVFCTRRNTSIRWLSYIIIKLHRSASVNAARSVISLIRSIFNNIHLKFNGSALPRSILAEWHLRISCWFFIRKARFDFLKYKLYPLHCCIKLIRQSTDGSYNTTYLYF